MDVAGVGLQVVMKMMGGVEREVVGGKGDGWMRR